MFFVAKVNIFKGRVRLMIPFEIFKYPQITFLHRNCLKSGIYGTGSENFKTKSKAYYPNPNIHSPKNDIYRPKNDIYGPKIACKVVFTKPEVTILNPEVKHIIPIQISIVQTMTLLDQKL